MNDWEDSEVMYDEDSLENFLGMIKEKVYEAWEKGYQGDAEVRITFEKDEE